MLNSTPIPKVKFILLNYYIKLLLAVLERISIVSYRN